MTKDGMKLRTMTWQGSIARALAGRVMRDIASAATDPPDPPPAATIIESAASLPPRPPNAPNPAAHTAQEAPQSSGGPIEPIHQQTGKHANGVSASSEAAAPWRSSRVKLQKASSFSQQFLPASSLEAAGSEAPVGSLHESRQDASSGTEFASCRSDADSALSTLDDSCLQQWQQGSEDGMGPSNGIEHAASSPQQPPATPKRSFSGGARFEYSPMKQQSIVELADEPPAVPAQDPPRQPSITDLHESSLIEANDAASAGDNVPDMSPPDGSRSALHQPAAGSGTPARSEQRLTFAQWLPVEKPTGRLIPVTNTATSVYDVSRLAGTQALTQVLARVLHSNILGTEAAGEVVQAIRQKLLTKLQALEVIPLRSMLDWVEAQELHDCSLEARTPACLLCNQQDPRGLCLPRNLDGVLARSSCAFVC